MQGTAVGLEEAQGIKKKKKKMQHCSDCLQIQQERKTWTQT